MALPLSLTTNLNLALIPKYKVSISWRKSAQKFIVPKSVKSSQGFGAAGCNCRAGNGCCVRRLVQAPEDARFSNGATPGRRKLEFGLCMSKMTAIFLLRLSIFANFGIIV